MHCCLAIAGGERGTRTLGDAVINKKYTAFLYHQTSSKLDNFIVENKNDNNNITTNNSS